MSTYDFSTFYTTLPHNSIKEKLINLIEWTFKREGSPYIACNERQAFFTSEDTKRYKLWSCQNVCEALIYLLDNIYIRFGTKLYRQIVGIPMGINSAPLVADLFLFCYERDFMTSLSDVKQAEIIEAFKSTSKYLDDLLHIDNPYFEGMVNRIYPPELQLNKANTSDTEAPFLDLHFSISNGFVSSKIYDKRDDFNFDIVNFPFLDGDVPRSTSGEVLNKNSGEVLNKLKSRGFRATSLSTYDFSTFYTTLPHNLIKEKLINLIEWTFKREGSPFLDLHLSISNGFVSSKIYDKRDDFDFDIVNFPFLDGDVPRSTSYLLFLNLFGLLECLVMWLISMPVIKV